MASIFGDYPSWEDMVYDQGPPGFSFEEKQKRQLGIYFSAVSEAQLSILEKENKILDPKKAKQNPQSLDCPTFEWLIHVNE